MSRPLQEKVEMMMSPSRWLVRRLAGSLPLIAALAFAAPAAAQEETQAEVHQEPQLPNILVILDANSIDAAALPAESANELIADVGVREELHYFAVRVGQHITLQGGTTDNNAWFALRAVPESWESEPGAADGLHNFELAGPGLGSPDDSGERETLLHDVPNVVPLRSAGLELLWGRQVCAVVYDRELAIAGNPPTADLTGATLGIIAFRVEAVIPAETGSLPNLEIEVQEAHETCAAGLTAFDNAPDPLAVP